MVAFFSALYLIFSLFILAYGYSIRFWEIGSLVYFFGMAWLCASAWPVVLCLGLVFLGIFLLLHVTSIRSGISHFIFKHARGLIPSISATEAQALNAGDTWFEKDLFMGVINWHKLTHTSTHLTAEEQAFLDHETTNLCGMLNEWSIMQDKDLPESVWDYMRHHGFFGLVIEKKYGGKGFSARAHSDIVMKIASRSGVAAVTVMVPNSLGPGELLQHYGTEEQKNHFLPRLAKGLDLPCFALTEPEAGSDATSIQSEAKVFWHEVDGQPVLSLNLTIDKRWITLSPVATLIGLAVQLKDPDGLLHGVGTEGITCLLVSRDRPNLEIGHRHLPADQPFMNGTIRGKNIIVPITSIIGGQSQAGRGWQMLVECLSIGRSISLPALATASSAVSYMTTGAFARIRRQFNVEIGQFEGVEEKLAKMAGLQYLINATRLLTLAAVNEHKKPSVASAITKYFNTELARVVINDAMDVHGGRVVVNGPRNYLMNYYQGIPISITVEGANIMSRNLLIFGQGAMACHPFIRDEFYAIEQQDSQRFHQLLWQHIAYFLRNGAKAISSAWTGGWCLMPPNIGLKREYQKLLRLTHAFSWLSDVLLLTLGGQLKRKERVSARLADALSYLYMAKATLLYVHQQNDRVDEQLHAKWATRYCFHQAQYAMISCCQQLRARPLGWILRVLMFPWGQSMRVPSDALDHQLAQCMMKNNHYRETLAQSIYLSHDPHQPVDRMEHALQLILEHGHLYKKVPQLRRYRFHDLKEPLDRALAEGLLTPEEAQALWTLEQARWDAILVDEFTFDSMRHKLYTSVMD